ncbi:LCI fold-containing protein [Bacillus cereus]|uniref:LCI fold-containing protein n=1 Tax=Bacillus cereus TaxID=1396 RepID=UPI000BF4C0F6|nr:LCI fold-containing protein [Bacillus cereus]PFD04421.1 lysine 2,3-aminomutase [Bacillus cereus]PFD49410.1 lysine 2,3-aminomutase [Bacillus cereus]PFH93087.1 lysine 2,3-aminomutase [Bacillus cereus]
MFKKLVVGALATGIMLSGAGGAMAATPNIESPKQEKVTRAAAAGTLWMLKPGYFSKASVPSTIKEYGITWYLKKVYQEPNKTWTGYFEDKR